MAAAPESLTGLVQPPLLPQAAEEPHEFPWAGGGLLLVLVLVAVALRWRTLRGGGWSLGLRRQGALPAGALRVSATTRLNPQTEVHVVHWEGRRLLVASTLNTPAVVLAAHEESP